MTSIASTTITPTAAAAFASTSTTASHEAALGAANRRVSRIIGTRHRSWISRMPTAMRPCGASRSPRSAQHLQDDDRAGVHDEEAEEHRLRNRQARGERSDRNNPAGEQHLQWTGGEDDAPLRHQLAERQLQADDEQQRDHAELRQVLHLGAVGNEARAVRADDDAGDEEADDRRNVQPLEDDDDRQRGGEQDDEIAEDRAFSHVERLPQTWRDDRCQSTDNRRKPFSALNMDLSSAGLLSVGHAPVPTASRMCVKPSRASRSTRPRAMRCATRGPS